MKDERASEKAMKGFIEKRRLVGRPRRRWIDADDNEAKSNWRMSAEDRDAWRRRIEEAKAQAGL
jgi:hypothetical protein